MATTLAPNFTMQPRASTETDRRYLLADSVAPSESASMITDLGDGGDATPRARSPAPSVKSNNSRFRIPAGQSYERRGTIANPSTVPQPYKGFPSEAAYLAALHEWAESKKYVSVGNQGPLTGFYGTTTMEEYASRPAQDFGIKRKWKARKEAKREKQEAKISSRRNTVT